MLFSDNVPVEEELALKQLGAKKGLLVMGPDCGTAIVNGHPLCFANEVRRGPVGVVAASGTGAQEVSVLVDRFGSGCSQVLGTGGRDLSLAVGGIMMLQGIDALAADPATKVIVVVSKPPAPKIADAIVARLERCGKPAVVHFIGRPGKPTPGAKVRFASSLEETASLAVGSKAPGLAEVDQVVAAEAKGKAKGQRFVRGYFTGGTLCDEALYVLREKVSPVHSNIHPDKALRLADPFKSEGHTLLDLGDDVFTAGRPHPMIEPSTRVERMLAEADDPTVAVWLLDVVLGHGSHADPAGAVVPAILKAKAAAKRRKGSLTVLASVVGTERDFQGLAAQRAKLEAAGVRVLSSNARMARAAAGILAKMKA
jgi:succinyl-CoA synthetase alpha subunit